METSTEKIKVVWLCHFSNEQTRNRMQLSENRFLYTFVKRLLGKDTQNKQYSDIAPWISILIEEFEKMDHVELHVISPQVGLKGLTSEFEINGVQYHFYNPDISLLLSSLIRNVKLWLKLQPSSRIVNSFLKKIRPGIVNLIGAENYYHSCVVLDINKDIPACSDQLIAITAQVLAKQSIILVEKDKRVSNLYFS